MPLDTSDIPEFLKPRLRLFLSVDLVGSTKLKQTQETGFVPRRSEDGNENLGASWFSPVTDFYKFFEQEFSDEWLKYVENTSPHLNWTKGENPELWKTNGDELIYVKEIYDAYDAFACIVCWLEAVGSVRGIFKEHHSSLDLKSTGWIAGFPIRNHEVIFRRKFEIEDDFDRFHDNFLNHCYYLDKWYKKEKRGLVRDFIGPSIDTGFRIAKYATPRKFPISFDLAYLLSSVSPDGAMHGKIEFRFEGEFELKGVMGGRPYPVFWIDATSQSELTQAKDKISPPPPAQQAQDVSKFCEKLMEESIPGISRPFLIGASLPKLQRLPNGYEEQLRQVSEAWKKEYERLETRKEAQVKEADRQPHETEPEQSELDQFAKEVDS